MYHKTIFIQQMKR